MFDRNIIKQSLLYAALAVLYIVLVATIMSNAERVFGQHDKIFFTPIGVLLLFVVSAATMSMLVFGKPIMLYIDGKKREGIATAICTIGSLAIFTALYLFILSRFA